MEKFKTRVLADQLIQEIYNEHPEFAQLESMIPKQMDNWNGDQISLFLVDFSIILTRCTQIISDLINDYNESYQWRKMYELEQYHTIRDKFGVSDSEKIAKQMSFEQIQNELVASSVADRMKCKERSWYNLISVTQSRLGFMKQEQIFSRHQQ